MIPLFSAKPEGTAYIPQQNKFNKRLENEYFHKGRYNPAFSAIRAADLKKRKLSTPADRMEKACVFMDILMVHTDRK